MALNLKNKNILILGATGALGSALSRHASDAGARLILHGRTPSNLEALEGTLKLPSMKLPTAPVLWPLDFLYAQEDHIQTTLDELAQHIDYLDCILVCTAYSANQVPILEESHQSWLNALNVNVHVPRLVCKYAVRLLKYRDNLKFVFFADQNLDCVYQGAFGVSKALLKHLVTQINTEYENIGTMQAKLIQLPPLYTPLRAKRFPGELPSQNACVDKQAYQILTNLFE